MANRKARKRPEDLPPEEFLGPEFTRELRYEGGQVTVSHLMRQISDPAIYDSALWEALRRWWPVRLLRELAAQGSVETYKRSLSKILSRLAADPPEGVLVPFKWNRGRPQDTQAVFGFWCSEGKPALTTRVCDRLAKQFYPSDFALSLSDPKLRKNLRDRVRATIRRHQGSATKIS